MTGTEFFCLGKLTLVQVKFDSLVVLLLFNKEKDELLVHEIVLFDDITEFNGTK